MVSKTDVLALASLNWLHFVTGSPAPSSPGSPGKSASLVQMRELHGVGVDSVVGKLVAEGKVKVEGDVVMLVSTAEPTAQAHEVAADAPSVENVTPSKQLSAALALSAPKDGGQAETLRGFLDRLGANVVAVFHHADCVYLVERLLAGTAAEASARGDLSPEVIHRLHTAAGDAAALRAVVD